MEISIEPYLSHIGVYTGAIRLSPTEINVGENSSATLTCSNPDEDLKETLWSYSKMKGEANIAYFKGQCIASNFLNDNKLFTSVCNKNGTFAVIINNINRTQHGTEWTCRDIESSSNNVTIHVSGNYI